MSSLLYIPHHILVVNTICFVLVSKKNMCVEPLILRHRHFVGGSVLVASPQAWSGWNPHQHASRDSPCIFDHLGCCIGFLKSPNGPPFPKHLTPPRLLFRKSGSFRTKPMDIHPKPLGIGVSRQKRSVRRRPFPTCFVVCGVFR